MRTRLRSSAAILSNNFDGARFAALRADHLDACSASSDGPGIRVTCNLFGRAHDATGRTHEIGSGRARPERAASRRNPDLDLSQVVTVEPRAVSGAAKITRTTRA
jgi:hypothetical protein